MNYTAKNLHTQVLLLIILFISTLFVSCSREEKDLPAGYQTVVAADGISFNMVYVPGGKTFPTGLLDSGTATLQNGYWLGETEVTYEVWNKVYTWAVANGYSFDHPGVQGYNSGFTNNQHMVTTICWRDAIVWCNALTEWYNAMIGSDLECVYTYSGAIIRSSNSTCDSAVAGTTAKGFRLPTSREWELAARWRNDSTNTVAGYSNPWYTKGDSASGATAVYTDPAATDPVAWYSSNSSSATHEVKLKAPNSLGIYDMSGNIQELCFTLSGSTVNERGGSWNLSGRLQVGDDTVYIATTTTDNSLGMRIAWSPKIN